MLFGGGGHAEPMPAEAAPPAQPGEQDVGERGDHDPAERGDQVQSKDFVNCLEKTNDMNACAYYLEQLKACQAAARGF